jgi:hypothetical protein
MPPVAVLTTASKANLTGGTFADSLTANSGDSLSVANYTSGGARIVAAWAIDSDSVMEGEMYYTRPESTHDTQNGFRFEVPAAALGGAATNAAFNIMGSGVEIPQFVNDLLTIKVSGSASDDAVVSFLSLYDDLPGAGPAQFTSWDRVKALRKSNVGINLLAVASATPGAYGAARAITTDDNRFHANTYYALLGWTVQTQVTTISFIGPPWGGQRIGGPAGALYLNTSTYFKDLSEQHGLPLIPFFNQADAANISCYVADGEASTSPKIDLNLVELTGMP